MDCPECKNDCCNQRLHDLRNGSLSLAYIVNRFKAGHINDDLIERMEFDVARINKALAHCIRGTCD